jgi:glycerol-3-phosphate dehydrogenase
MSSAEPVVAVIGGGVVGCAVAHALCARGVPVVVLEAERDLALGASGANSGILHTGFDSVPGELETRLILRSAELRETLLADLGVQAWRCGARMTPISRGDGEAVAALAANAEVNGVEYHREPDGSLRVPGESVTDPVAYVRALAGAAVVGGARIRLGARVQELGPGELGLSLGLAGEERLECAAAVNCAGLFADEVAGLAGEDLVEIYPRKGEFLVFSSPPVRLLSEILLPVPSSMGKGVLVFPTLDGHIIAGPTARERLDKRDWSVEGDATEQILTRATAMFPSLQAGAPVAAYAGLRPAGRGANYVIERSAALPGLVHVAAIRSTGLSASLGIGEHVAGMLGEMGVVELGRHRPLTPPDEPAPAGFWWERAARRQALEGLEGPVR